MLAGEGRGAVVEARVPDIKPHGELFFPGLPSCLLMIGWQVYLSTPYLYYWVAGQAYSLPTGRSQNAFKQVVRVHQYIIV